VTTALTTLLRGESVALDELGRPTLFFAETVHDHCPRLARFALREFATAPGDPSRCLYQVGCKGTRARGDCPTRLWQGRSYCIKANHPCIGCTAPGFLNARPTVDGKSVGAEGLATSPLYRNPELLP
jgi:Ni,Fe-hydrogenase I small subunit